ncbi:MAG TPA: diguanylate cyclase [Thermodesulfobacteriota bacterium]|nr:diguanylate cyclase [Thermodesulfobacteriota bacterium]
MGFGPGKSIVYVPSFHVIAGLGMAAPIRRSDQRNDSPVQTQRHCDSPSNEEPCREINQGTVTDEILKRFAEDLSSLFPEDSIVIHLLNPKEDLLEPVLTHGETRLFSRAFHPGEGLPGAAFLKGEPVAAKDLADSGALWTDEAKREGIVSALAAPLGGTASSLGTVTLLRPNPREYTDRDILFCRSLADLAGLNMEKAGQNDRARSALIHEEQIRKHLENIVDRSIDPIIATDLHGGITFVNRGAEEMLGLSREKILGKRMMEFYAGGRAEAGKIMSMLTRNEKLRHYETEFLGGGGRKISVILSASLMRDDQGNPVGTLGVSREITEYKNLLNHINRTEQTYQKLFEAVNDAIFYLDAEGRFHTFNRMFLKMTGFTDREIRNAHFSKIVHPDDLPVAEADHRKVMRGEYAPERSTFRLINRDERVIYVEGNFRRVKEGNQVVGVLAVLRDVTEKIRLEKELLELSITDGLTGLHNQRHFYNELDKELDRTKRQNSTLSLLLFDLDDFKVFNDIHGHLEGDKVLKSVAEAVLKSIRRMDSAYRYGGDEFTVILPGATKDEGAHVAERIKKTFEIMPYLKQIRLSIGLVEFDPAYDLTKFVKHADEAMYIAKKMGGDQIHVLPK